MKGNIIEHIKNYIMLLLFICMLVLAAFFIMQTQRLTLAPPSDISLDSLLVLKTGQNVNVKYKQDLLYPEFIGYKSRTQTPRGYLNNAMISNIYPQISKYIVNMLGNGSNCTMITTDADEYWNELLKSESYVYVKYHTQIPNAMLYAYLTDDYLIEYTELASGDMVYIKEMMLVLKFTEDNNYEYEMVIRDTEGNTALFEIFTDTPQNRYFDESIFNTYINSDYVYFDFAGNIEHDYKNIKLNKSSVIYTSEMMLQEIKIEKSIKPENYDEILEQFNYNPARSDLSYTENEGKTNVYVDINGILRISSDGYINYKYSDNDILQDNKIFIYDYLSYNKNNSNYSVYEIIIAVNNFIETLDYNNNVVFGDMYIEDSDIVIDYYYNYTNFLILDGDYKPIMAYKFVINENYFKEININMMEITPVGRKKNLPTDIVMTIYDRATENNIQADIELAYIFNETDTTYIPDYILRAKNELE